MTISDIEAHIMTLGRASLGDMADHFGSSPAAVRGLLQHCLARGRIRLAERQGGCGCACSDCPSETYEWVG